MTEALDYVFDEGPEVGYHLKRTKGVYLLGRCEDRVLYLLLRWCFCQKIIHLQRTIPPNLIGTYLEPGFTELKKLILNSILGRADGIPPKTFDLAELHIQDSGLGLFNSADTTKAAFLASFVECASVLASEVSLEDPELNTGMVQEALSSSTPSIRLSLKTA